MPDFPDYVHAIYTSVKNTWQDAENLDDTHGYVSYVWIPEETFKVDVLKLHVWAEKFRAHSKAALAGGAVVVTSGASSITTTVGGGAHSHTVTGATSSYVTPSHTHDVAIGTKTSASGGAHAHMWGWYAQSSPYSGNSRGYQAWDINANRNREFNLTVLDDMDMYTDTTWAHTHDVVIGTVTSASGGGYHAHTVSGQTAEAVTAHSHGMEHTHQVTLTDHTHGIDFGIYEEAITGRTLSAILYDPSGNLVKDFGVVCTGEDSVILDLSEYFETLQYGTWRLELTASGRLRARLLYYELCKMYAQH